MKTYIIRNNGLLWSVSKLTLTLYKRAGFKFYKNISVPPRYRLHLATGSELIITGDKRTFFGNSIIPGGNFKSDYGKLEMVLIGQGLL
jgi:hypothetical protein